MQLRGCITHLVSMSLATLWVAPSCPVYVLHASAPCRAAQPAAALAFHINETTISFPLNDEEVRRLSQALTGVMATFAEKQQAERPKRWPAMEFVFKGEPRPGQGCRSAKWLAVAGRQGGAPLRHAQHALHTHMQRLPRPDLGCCVPARLPAGDTAAREIEHLEVFCNPNAHATAFDAKALVTLRTADGLRLTTESKLTAIKADVEQYLRQL